ncbi:classical arabinogalactan protein 9-like [Zingiber officinale]|uniref:classical arabinogalactan protein 9-like n=1 Tax=Zingiber officinale TaxID=94328 RepID=UPI001C4AA91B|nr:classical arabinogalactan protein 9-like [Zingiber officinale]
MVPSPELPTPTVFTIPPAISPVYPTPPPVAPTAYPTPPPPVSATVYPVPPPAMPTGVSDTSSSNVYYCIPDTLPPTVLASAYAAAPEAPTLAYPTVPLVIPVPVVPPVPASSYDRGGSTESECGQEKEADRSDFRTDPVATSYQTTAGWSQSVGSGYFWGIWPTSEIKADFLRTFSVISAKSEIVL